MLVHLAPVPSPVGINAGVHGELHVMHGPGDEVIAQRAPGFNHLSTKEEQEEEQCRCGREDRPLKSREACTLGRKRGLNKNLDKCAYYAAF